MAKLTWCWIAILSLGWAVAVSAQTPAPTRPAGRSEKHAAAPNNARQTGSISGRVLDRHGQPQTGVSVSIMRQDGRYVEKVYTQPNGQFRLGNLQPGIYAAEVAQPSFLPYWKSSIAIDAGAEFLLDISLISLADSVEIGLPESLTLATDSWKWALRASYPARPILRFQPELAAKATATSNDAPQDPRERALRGTVQIVAGNDSRGFGQEPGLRTAFDMAYAIHGSQKLGLAGSAGWERSTPAASMRAAWIRPSDDGDSSTVSMTVRQLFLTSEYWASQGNFAAPPDRRVQSMTVGYEEDKRLGDRVRLHMGSLYDTLNFGHRMTRWSPFGRLTFLPNENSGLTIVYTAANPHVLPDGDESRQRVDQVLAIPQISSDGLAQPVLEGGRHLETQWEQRIGPHVRFQAAAFYDQLSHTALSMAFPASDEFSNGLLRDPFSDRYFLSGGGVSSPGARVAVATRLAPTAELIVGYSYAGTLEAPSPDIPVQDAAELRASLHARRENSLTVKMNSQIHATHTRLVTSYRWLAQNAVAVSDPYDHGLSRSEPYLNLFILQPIPSPDILPGQFEAMADFSNLLAQGYIAVRTPGGSTGTLFPAPRSFRGGFNFIF